MTGICASGCGLGLFDVVCWGFFLLTGFAAWRVVGSADIVRSAFSLLLCLFGVA